MYTCVHSFRRHVVRALVTSSSIAKWDAQKVLKNLHGCIKKLRRVAVSHAVTEDNKVWLQVKKSLRTFFAGLNQPGRTANMGRAARQAVCAALVVGMEDEQSVNAMGRVLHVDPRHLRRAKKRWEDIFNGDEEAMYDLRGAIRNDKMPREWVDFAINVWLEETRASERAKDTIRNPKNRKDKKLHRMHWLEMTIGDMVKLTQEKGKEEFGNGFHFSWWCAIKIRPFQVKPVRREVCVCVYCLYFDLQAAALHQHRKSNKDENRCECRVPLMKNGTALRRALTCQRPDGERFDDFSCINQSCQACGGLHLMKMCRCEGTGEHEVKMERDRQPADAAMLDLDAEGEDDEDDEDGPRRSEAEHSVEGVRQEEQKATPPDPKLIKWERHENITCVTKDGQERKRKDFVPVQTTFVEFHRHFEAYFPFFQLHHDTGKWQDADVAALKRLDGDALKGSVFDMQDHSENYHIMAKIEHQSAHFSNVGVTLHGVMAYIRVEDLLNVDDEEKKKIMAHLQKHKKPLVIREAHMFVSPDLTHDNAFVQHVNDKVMMPHYKNNVKGFRKQITASDGAPTQFKLSCHAHWMSTCHVKHGVHRDWIFRGTAHGKDDMDPELGTHKNAADRHQLKASRDKTSNLKTAWGFHEWMMQERQKCKKNFHDKPGTGLFRRFTCYIPSGAVSRNIRRCSRLKGTKKLHQIIDVGIAGRVKVRRRSCHMCTACKNGDHELECDNAQRVGTWETRTLIPDPLDTSRQPEELTKQAEDIVLDGKHGDCFAIEINAARTRGDDDQILEEEKKAMLHSAEVRQTPFALVKCLGGGIKEVLGDRHDMRTPLGVRKVGDMCIDVQLYLPMEPGANVYRLTDQTFPAPYAACRRKVSLKECNTSARRSRRARDPWSKRYSITSAEKAATMNSLS